MRVDQASATPVPRPFLCRCPPGAGVRNISNCLSIRADFDRHAAGLHEHARRRGLWRDGDGPLDWAAAFSEGGAPPPGRLTPGREAAGAALLRAAAGPVAPARLMDILRDQRSGICQTGPQFTTNL